MTTIRPYDMGIVDSTIDHMPIQSISWGSFRGPVPANPPYFAHIYWNIDYKCSFRTAGSFQPTVLTKPYINKKSWAREELVSDRLLRHEYGHYLIGCLCALRIQQRINKQTKQVFSSKDEAIAYVNRIFKEILREYCALEKKYDEETDHYYNQQDQAKWEKWITEQINSHAEPVLVEKPLRPASSQAKTSLKTSQSEEKLSAGSQQSSLGKYRSNCSSQDRSRHHTRSSRPNIRVHKKMTLPPLPKPTLCR